MFRLRLPFSSALLGLLLAGCAQPPQSQARQSETDAKVLGDWMFAYEYSRRCPGLDTLDLAVLDERLSELYRIPADGEDPNVHSPSTPGATGYAFAERERVETQAARLAACGDVSAQNRIAAARTALAPYRMGWLKVAARLIEDPPRRLAPEAGAGIDPEALRTLIETMPKDVAADRFARAMEDAIRWDDRRGRNLGEIYINVDGRDADVADRAGLALTAARIALSAPEPVALHAASLVPNRPSIAPTVEAFWDAFAAGPLRARSPESRYADDVSGLACTALTAQIALMRDGRVLVRAPKTQADPVTFTLILRDTDRAPAPDVAIEGQIDDWRWPSFARSRAGAPAQGAARTFPLVNAPKADEALMAAPAWRTPANDAGSVLAAGPDAGRLLVRLSPTDSASVRAEGPSCSPVTIHIPLGGLGYALSWSEAMEGR